MLIAATICLLVYGSVSLEDSPPDLEVFLGNVREERGLFAIPVIVRNRGARPAAGVRVEVELTREGASERAAFELAYSPGGSTRRGQVTFLTDPRGGSLRARAPGFEFP